MYINELAHNGIMFAIIDTTLYILYIIYEFNDCIVVDYENIRDLLVRIIEAIESNCVFPFYTP